MHACVATLESLFGSVNYSHEVVGVRTAAEGEEIQRKLSADYRPTLLGKSLKSPEGGGGE